MLIFTLGLILNYFSIRFFDTLGFVSKKASDGTLQYCRDYQSLGSDADVALVFGFIVFFFSTIFQISLKSHMKPRIWILSFLWSINIIWFWFSSLSEMADIVLTISETMNVNLLIWLGVSHILIPIALIIEGLKNDRIQLKYNQGI